MGRVRRVEGADHPGPESRQQLVVLPFGIKARSSRLLPTGSKERSRATRPNEHREGFVERSLTRRVKRIVGKLVDDRVGKRKRVAFERGVEQGIVEESQSAERIGWPHVHIEAIGSEILRIFSRGGEVEVAFVRNASNDGKPPSVRLEGIAIGR